MSYDQAYRAKRRAMDLIQGVGMDHFSHLRRYAHELLKSNHNNNIVVQCAYSNEDHIFKRIYVCLDSYKYGFAKHCRPLIGFGYLFFERRLWWTIGGSCGEGWK